MQQTVASNSCFSISSCPPLILSVRRADYEELPTSADTIDYYGQTNRTVLVYLIEHVVIGSLNHCFFWGGGRKALRHILSAPIYPGADSWVHEKHSTSIIAFWKPTD